MNSEFKIMFTPSTEGFMSYLHPYRNSRSGSHFTILAFDKILISFLSESVLNHSLTSQTGLLVGSGKKSNFVGFLGANSQKKRPLAWEFRGSFRGQFRWKMIGSFRSKFRWKAIAFALIWGKFSMKLDALIDLLRLHTAIWKHTLQESLLNITKTK